VAGNLSGSIQATNGERLSNCKVWCHYRSKLMISEICIIRLLHHKVMYSSHLCTTVPAMRLSPMATEIDRSCVAAISYNI